MPQVADSYPSLGHALAAMGYTHSVTFNQQERRQFGRFNPDHTAIWTLAGLTKRYGVDFATVGGNLVGERFSQETLEEFVRRGFVPGYNPPGYTASWIDQYDAKLLSRGLRPAYDDMAQKLLAEDPPSPPVPAPPPPPPPPPPPAPPKPPTSGSRLTAYLVEFWPNEGSDGEEPLDTALRLLERYRRVRAILTDLPVALRRAEGD